MSKGIIIRGIILLFLVSSAAYAYDQTYEKAIKHFKGREYRHAIPFLESYVLKNPDPAAYYMLGYAYYELRNFELSRDYFEQAYLIDPGFSSDNVPAHSGLSSDEQGLIHEALELSGAKKQMENYAEILSSAVPQFRLGVSEGKQNDEILLFLRDSYKMNKVYPHVVDTFNARFNKKYLSSVVQWLKTPLGKKSAGLEVAANMPQMLKKSAAFHEAYDSMRGGRKQSIREMENAVRSTELNVDIVAASLFEMLKGMQARMQGRSRLTSEEIDDIVRNVRGIPRERLTRDLLVSLAFTYRDLNDDELDEVVRFYRSPEGRWFNDTSMEAISSAIGKASREVGEKMGNALLVKRVML